MSDYFDNYVPAVEVPVIEHKILIVEDESVLAKAVQKRLKRSGFNSAIAHDLEQARTTVKEFEPELILLDMRLPDGSGLDFLSELRNKYQSSVAVLVMSAYGEIEDVVSAMKLGASDYLKKPVDMDELMLNVEKVLGNQELEQKLTYSTKREQHAVDVGGVEFLGQSPQMMEIRQQVERISLLTQSADTIPPTVLILGETGTGKDVLARVLHASSARIQKPFVHMDCASLPKDLIEAELFGHEKGAFTNAHIERTGLIEAAEDGVLFIDEIGELPLDLQGKLLAVLERRSMRKVGTTQERPVPAWFIAATNRDIDSLMQTGEFRSDLFYRLNVLSITLPPLRERGKDKLLLAKYFVTQTAKRYGLDTPVLSSSAVETINEYSWPGNIREMKHLIERAVLLSLGAEITSEQLALIDTARADNSSVNMNEDMTLNEAELNMINQALTKTDGNVSKAARELGITRMTLRYRMKKYGL